MLSPPSRRAPENHDHRKLGLAGGSISGVIDFGDLIWAPLVQDLATAAAYQVDRRGHPLAGAAEVARGYHAVCPLVPGEVEVLFDLMVARLVLSVAISNWHARRHPENREYILRNTGQARDSLRSLRSLPCAQAGDYFCGALEG